MKAGLRYAVLIAVGLLMLYPLLWMVGGAFKPNHEIFDSIGFIPHEPTLEGFTKGWQTSTEYTFARYLLNTFAIIIPKVIVTVVSSVLVAFGFARFNVPGKRVLFTLLIATILLPKSVLLVPQYLMFREMEEAAVMDGCNSLQVLWHVVVPVIMPAIISVALFQFMWSMNDFLSPLIYLSSVEKYPVALALKLSIDVTEATSWNQILAMSTIALLPSLVLFFAAQKYFVEGITVGAVKG